MKKFSILIAILSLLLAVAACGKNNAGSSSDSGNGGGSEGQTASEAVAPAGTFPLVKDKATLKILVIANENIDYPTNEFTKWYEDYTNVHIDWEVVPSNNAMDQLNLKLSSGQYPDIIMGFPITPTQMMIYGQQGIFLPLNDLIDKYGVDAKKAFETTPQAKEISTAPDGNIYALPRINVCYHCSYQQKMWIYQPWLDKLGLKMPTTTDEFYNVLKAFKEKDPNGNGKADEIPLASRVSTGSDSIVPFLMNSFIYTSYFNENTKDMYLEDGKVQTAYDKPQWKEGLEYFKKLYDDKLLAPETFTQSADQLMNMGENPDAPILGAAPGIIPGLFTQWQGPSGRSAGYVAVPPLKGPEGVQYSGWDAYSIGNTGFLVITNNCKNPDLAYRWADAFYSKDVTFRSSVGRPGVEWRDAKPGEIGLDGGPATYFVNSEGDNAQWFSSGLANKTNAQRMSRVTNPDNPLEDILYKESKEKYEPHRPDINQIVPPLFFTNEQAAEIAPIQKAVGDYVNEMFARFVTGDADLEKDWDTYLQTLKSMKVDRLLEIYQSAYDEYKKQN